MYPYPSIVLLTLSCMCLIPYTRYLGKILPQYQAYRELYDVSPRICHHKCAQINAANTCNTQPTHLTVVNTNKQEKRYY